MLMFSRSWQKQYFGQLFVSESNTCLSCCDLHQQLLFASKGTASDFCDCVVGERLLRLSSWNICTRVCNVEPPSFANPHLEKCVPWLGTEIYVYIVQTIWLWVHTSTALFESILGRNIRFLFPSCWGMVLEASNRMTESTSQTFTRGSEGVSVMHGSW